MEKILYFWQKEDIIWVCEYEIERRIGIRENSTYFRKIPGSERVFKICQSKKEAEEEIKKL